MVIHKPKNILIAPLDWGLGHTARCVPIIRHIQSRGHRVIVAGNSAQQSFITATIGNIATIDLEGYNVTYSKWNKWGQIGVLSQLPGIHKKISAEHKWLEQQCSELQPDGVISDNRYGLFAMGIPSVILTHQLRVQTGLGNIPDNAIQKIHYKYLNRFDATWVVDTATPPGLAGILSHTHVLPKRSAYIGLLSRFEGMETVNNTNGSLLILLSGPEPQRSELSRMLWQQVLRYEGKVIFVEGSDNVMPPASIPPHITYHQRLTDAELAPLLCNASMVVCRSGYSTLMDLTALSKKAILIPTPGQTEQEYLGKHLHQQGVFYTKEQRGFELEKALKKAQQFPFHTPGFEGAYAGYKHVVDDWLGAL